MASLRLLLWHGPLLLRRPHLLLDEALVVVLLVLQLPLLPPVEVVHVLHPLPRVPRVQDGVWGDGLALPDDAAGVVLEEEGLEGLVLEALLLALLQHGRQLAQVLLLAGALEAVAQEHKVVTKLVPASVELTPKLK